jgi:hypothetical protein
MVHLDVANEKIQILGKRGHIRGVTALARASSMPACIPSKKMVIRKPEVIHEILQAARVLVTPMQQHDAFGVGRGP